MKKLKWMIRSLILIKWGALLIFLIAVGTLWLSGEADMNLSTNYVTLDDRKIERQLEETIRFGEYQLMVTDYDLEFPSTQAVKAMASGFALLVLAYLYGLLQLIIKLMKDVEKGHSFKGRNISRLKQIALLIFLAPLLMETLQQIFLAIFTALHPLPVELGLRFGLELNIGVLVVGALLYAISVAFEEGAKMKEEQELTI